MAALLRGGNWGERVRQGARRTRVGGAFPASAGRQTSQGSYREAAENIAEKVQGSCQSATEKVMRSWPYTGVKLLGS